jgi:acetoin utilization deacetylase AcuC-like enzyme
MVNIPLPARSDGARFREAVETEWVPALERFRPQMVFVSAGFDAHREDDMAALNLTEADYAWVTERIMELAARHSQRRIVSTLEGGYALSALGRSVAAHLKTLAHL